MLKTVLEYCKNNLALVCVLAACLLLVVISVIALCVKKAAARKQSKKSFSSQTPLEEEASASSKTPQPAADEKQDELEEAEKENLSEPKNEDTENALDSSREQTEQIEESEESEIKTPLIVQTSTLKKTPPKPRTDRIKPSRYTGKWTICRVIASADENDEGAEETFFFELHASNGEKLLTSEEYTSLSGAVAGIATHKANIEKNRFRITLSKKGDYIFKLLNGKNMLLCMGEHYATKSSCEHAIESTKRFASTALIDDNVQDIVVPATVEDEPVRELPENGYNGKWIVRSHTADDFEQVFYFELYASNGEKLLSSEEYTTYTGAINGIETHKTNIEKDRFRVSFTKRGDYIYKLLNGNGQLLCLGEHYKTRSRCEHAIESVKRFAKTAPVLADETIAKHS